LRFLTRDRVTNVSLALASVVVAAAIALGYWHLLNRELAGYRGVKDYQLEKTREREQRRREIIAVPAVRERILAKEFKDLPEPGDIRVDLQLLRIWQHLLVGWLAVFGLGAALYVLFSRRKVLWRRLMLGAAVVLGASQALPLMLLPAEALKVFYRFGIWLIAAAALVFLVEVVREVMAARRAPTDAPPAP